MWKYSIVNALNANIPRCKYSVQSCTRGSAIRPNCPDWGKQICRRIFGFWILCERCSSSSATVSEAVPLINHSSYYDQWRPHQTSHQGLPLTTLCREEAIQHMSSYWFNVLAEANLESLSFFWLGLYILSSHVHLTI